MAPHPSSQAMACPTVTGTIMVNGIDDSMSNFLSGTPNAYGEYGVSNTPTDALTVQYTTCDSSGPLDLITLVRPRHVGTGTGCPLTNI